MDYKRSKGYWFLVALHIAEAISIKPSLRARYDTDYSLSNIDLLDIYDRGLEAFEIREKIRVRYWL